MASDRYDKFEQVDKGRVEVWQAENGIFGVRLLPDPGEPGFPGTSYVSTEDPDGFANEFDADVLMEWAKRKWAERLGR
jgi:hypothetical protein